jgi:hypothetical protein
MKATIILENGKRIKQYIIPHGPYFGPHIMYKGQRRDIEWMEGDMEGDENLPVWGQTWKIGEVLKPKRPY